MTAVLLRPTGPAGPVVMSEGSSALEVNLTDHMAESVSASDLAKRGAKNNDGPLGTFFADLAREIDIDRRTLESVASQVHSRR